VASTPAPAPAARGLQRGQLCALLGLVASGWAVFIFPLVLGPTGMLLGGIAMLRGERRGRWVILVASVALVLGVILDLLPDKFVSN
jgi:hypothetical protein